mmetsp:Transcript_94675/g.203257  ORF Transcript_94675/g.203257 Transcript_94675/m.203257 type:complete len:256 (+) Transcript_94675:659-1426(+)
MGRSTVSSTVSSTVPTWRICIRDSRKPRRTQNAPCGTSRRTRSFSGTACTARKPSAGSLRAACRMSSVALGAEGASRRVTWHGRRPSAGGQPSSMMPSLRRRFRRRRRRQPPRWRWPSDPWAVRLCRAPQRPLSRPPPRPRKPAAEARLALRRRRRQSGMLERQGIQLAQAPRKQCWGVRHPATLQGQQHRRPRDQLCRRSRRCSRRRVMARARRTPCVQRALMKMPLSRPCSMAAAEVAGLQTLHRAARRSRRK